MSKKLKNIFFNLTEKSELNIFSRATVGIYSLFKVIKEKNKSIIFPSTICASPIYASIFAKIKPVFCDVNLSDGNMNSTSLEKLLKKNKKNILAVFAANMYGNPCDAKQIKKISKKYTDYFIEDCAQSLGTKNENKFTGFHGDISIFSFGYSKNIDVGGGGILLSKDKVLKKELGQVYKNVKFMKNKNIKLNHYYKKKYFEYIRSKNKKGFLKFININFFKNLFLFKTNNSWIKNAEIKLKKLRFLKEINFSKFLIYKKSLSKDFKIMNINENTFAWRFNLFENKKENRDEKLNLFWKKGGHANILYPNIPLFLFNKNDSIKKSSIIEKNIINLPLDEKFSITKLKKNLDLFKKIFNK